MKKTVLALLALIVSMTVGAQEIERTSQFDGGKVEISSARKIFSGCELRMCNYTKNGKVVYGIELDLTDKTNHVCEGNNLTIHFEDGSRITVSNLFDTEADVHHESYVRSYDHSYTEFVPVYDAWLDAVYAEPITHHYTEHVPQTETSSFIRLYYVVTTEQIQKIITSDIKNVTIVTDDNTIVKKARPFSEAVEELFAVVKK